MRHRLHAAVLRLVPTLALLVAPVTAAAAQDGPPPEVRAAIGAIERMLTSQGDAALQRFAAERLAPAYRERFSAEALLAHLRSLQAAVEGSVNDVTVQRADDGLLLTLSAQREVTIAFDLDEAARVTRLELVETPGRLVGDDGTPWLARSWESLPEDLRAAEAAGFSGVVLAVRDGREVVREAYGLADRDTGRPTARTTIYGIGSTPIDFTITGILLLGQRGQLALDDSVGTYLAGVPADKRGMTLRHLLSGRSGLPNFHDRPGVDWDADLAWIDRETAVRRILEAPLRFAPGTDEAHSHSAFGLLAAVIEIVSGRSYPDFVRAEILEPVGMARTGFYGQTGGYGLTDFAPGYGTSAVGLPNIPPNWGPTSWLVMGSGGMYSTLDDMARYYAAIDAGRLLAGPWAAWQQGETVGVGGSDRGYFFYHVSTGHGSRVLLLMNGEGRAPRVRAFVESLERLVLGSGRP